MGKAFDDSSRTRNPRGRFALWIVFVVLASASMGMVMHLLSIGDESPHFIQRPEVCFIGLLMIAATTSWSRYWRAVLLVPPAFVLAFSLNYAGETGEGSGIVWAFSVMLLFMTSFGTVTVLLVTRLARSAWDEHRSDVDAPARSSHHENSAP